MRFDLNQRFAVDDQKGARRASDAERVFGGKPAAAARVVIGVGKIPTLYFLLRDSVVGTVFELRPKVGMLEQVMAERNKVIFQQNIDLLAAIIHFFPVPHRETGQDPAA